MRQKATRGVRDGGRRGYLFDNLAVTATLFISDPFELFDLDGCGLQLITTGTVTGAWTVEQSMDYSSGDRDIRANAGTWNDITALLNATPTAVAAASNQYRQLGGGGGTTAVTNFFGGAIRIKFTGSANTGNITAIVLGKSVGS